MMRFGWILFGAAFLTVPGDAFAPATGAIRTMAPERASQRSRTWAVFATMPQRDEIPGGQQGTNGNLLKQLEYCVWFSPLFIAGAAFRLYPDTSRAFHNFVQFASQNWEGAADGGTEAATSLVPALNGPVATLVSIVFGTLVAMTLSSLYNRQRDMLLILVDTVEESRRIQLFVDSFQEPYQQKAKQLLSDYFNGIYKDYSQGVITPQSLREKKELSALTLLLNRASQSPDAPSMVIEEAYSSVGKLIELRTSLISAFRATFTPWHYLNMVILASTTCLIFLFETDQEHLQFLASFQLSVCWALLIGAFSMLAVGCYELNNPLSGIFRINLDFVRWSDSELEAVKQYSLAEGEGDLDVEEI